MKVGSSPQPSLENLPVDAQIDAELMSKELDQQRVDGAAAVQMIESSNIGVNMPLTSGPVGRRINIRV